MYDTAKTNSLNFHKNSGISFLNIHAISFYSFYLYVKRLYQHHYLCPTFLFVYKIYH